MKFCFASHNQNKVREIGEIAPEGITIIGLDELGVTEDIPEPGETFHENSEIKAKYVYDRFKIPVFADDSGLEVDALGGAPGVYSKRYADLEKSELSNNDLLLKNLGEAENRSARFKSVITFINAGGEQHQFEGSVEGEITKEPKGTGGFGYDPVFVPTGYRKTFAELPAATKNEFSHRARAFQQLLTYLKGLNE